MGGPLNLLLNKTYRPPLSLRDSIVHQYHDVYTTSTYNQTFGLIVNMFLIDNVILTSYSEW